MRFYIIQFFLLLFFVCEFKSSAQQIDSLKNIKILVTFASPPASFTVTKAPLRFNKSFAYSFQIDDGGKDIYALGFPFFKGGTIGTTTYPGLKFTDGCGNDHTFKMSSSLFSFSTYGGSEVDMHDPGGSYASLNITWPEIEVMLQNNWGVSNHGLTSSVADVEYDITRNHSYVKLKTQAFPTGGDDMGIFVNPNGSDAYTAPAFAQGYLACYREGFSFGTPSFDVTSNWDHNQVKMGRSGVGNSTNTVITLVNAMAAASSGNARHWGVHFTHSIENASWGYDFSTFRAVMGYVANTYGKTGQDNIWMATEEEVLDYLLVGDAITVNMQLTGSELIITYSGTIPSSYRFYNNSLLVSADQPIVSITATGISSTTFNGIGTFNSLINITWNGRSVTPAEVNAEIWVSKAEASHSQNDAKVAMDYVLMVPAGATQQAFRLRLCTITGISLPDSFCNMHYAPITSIPAIGACPNSQIPVPVLVNGFMNITSASLRLEYDSTLMTFVSGSAGKPAVLTGMQVTASPVGGGSTLKKILITWSNSTPKSLSASDTLAKLIFANVSGSGPVSFNTESGSSSDCEYKDENRNVMIDFPASTYYQNGQVNYTGLPAPGLITGPSTICPGTTGNVYDVSPVTGASGYEWNYPSGFSPTSGQNTNSITLTTLATAISGNIAVRAVNICNSNPLSPPFSVTVFPLPAPTITGYDSVCVNQSSFYYTESGMSGYQWIIGEGGSIISGEGSNLIQVLWTSVETKSVTVTYITTDGCITVLPGLKTVVVSYLNPSIGGETTACVSTSGNVYSTQSGMYLYDWVVTQGGIITSGLGTNSIQVSWNTTGIQGISVNYYNSFGCTAPNPVNLPVMVNPLPVPSIFGNAQHCTNSGSASYSTQPGMVVYSWSINSGGTITSGQGTSAILVNWTLPGPRSVFVNYTNSNGCTSAVAGALSVTINSVPAVPGPVTGETHICKPKDGLVYTVDPVPFATGYLWNLPPGTVITSGSNTHIITVNYNSGAQSGEISVICTNSCGPGTFSPPLPISVYPYPPTPVISQESSDTLVSSAASGNQWYFENQAIPGATGQRQVVNMSGHYFVLVNPFGCISDPSNVIYATAVGIDDKPTDDFRIYPNPGNGKLTICLNIEGEKKNLSIRVVDLLGKEIFRMPEQMVSGGIFRELDLGTSREGIYILILRLGNEQLTRKMVIEK